MSAPVSRERRSLHAWSLAMAAVSLAAIAVWIAAPAALSPAGMTFTFAGWTLVGLGGLYVRIGGYGRWADSITLVRALLTPALFAAYALDPRAAWWKVAFAIALILLDRVDGAVARRQGPSERGAVFDMETDAFFLVALCGIAYLYLGVSAAVFVIGGLRPLYVCGWAVLKLFIQPRSPNHAGTLRGRIVHVALVVALIADLAPPFAPAVKDAIAYTAAALIVYSYAADIVAGARRAHVASARDAVL